MFATSTWYEKNETREKAQITSGVQVYVLSDNLRDTMKVT